MSDHEIIFDYASSAPWEQVIRAYGGPEELNQRIREMAEEGRRKDECWEAIWDHEARRFEKDSAFRESVHGLYRSAGVDVLSITPWSHDRNVSERAGQRRDIARWQSRFDAADWLQKVTTPQEAREVARNDTVGIVLNTQNVDAAIDGRLDRINVLYDEGVRIFQLTYNYQNRAGTGCNDPSRGGLSAFGRDVVDRINELGGIVDLSHCGKRTTLDTIEYSTEPVAVTHAGCNGVADHYRGKSDEEIRALADADGYMGIVALPWFIAPNAEDPTLEVLIEHVQHAASIIGVENVGIATDFFPADTKFPAELLEYYEEYIIGLGFDRQEVEERSNIAGGLGDFETYEDWPAITQAMTDHFPRDEVEGIIGQNFFNFWERSV